MSSWSSCMSRGTFRVRWNSKIIFFAYYNVTVVTPKRVILTEIAILWASVKICNWTVVDVRLNARKFATHLACNAKRFISAYFEENCRCTGLPESDNKKRRGESWRSVLISSAFESKANSSSSFSWLSYVYHLIFPRRFLPFLFSFLFRLPFILDPFVYVNKSSL